MKSMKHSKWVHQLFRRRALVVILILIQLAFIVYAIISGSQLSRNFSRLLTVVSFFVALYVVSKREKGAFKLTWVFLVLLFPLFGGIFYLITNFQTASRNFAKKISNVEQKTREKFYYPKDDYSKASNCIPEHISQIRYLQKYAGFPIYSNTKTRYLASGEITWKVLIDELNKAEHYIFLEYFIVEEGVMWDEIFRILKDKAQAGVKVRLIYDDLGCFMILPQDFSQKLELYGIECAVFNPFKPFLTVKQNNRDHRKIAVIDGKVAITGGINLADEYINVFEKHGHWKDAAVLVEGKAAWSFTVMFLQMWEICRDAKEEYHTYYPWKENECSIVGDGFVQPYADSPMDTENVGEHVYMQIINNAKEYVYIYTPYLIIDDSMISALILAAKSGVDVRIITPHIWDKWLIHMTTRSYYRELIKAGVKVYEYSKGFLHAKAFVSDDCTATIGTTNLDFRSLYLHFECGVWLHGGKVISDLKQDFLHTLDECHQITLNDCSRNVFVKLFQDMLRVLAPLM